MKEVSREPGYVRRSAHATMNRYHGAAEPAKLVRVTTVPISLRVLLRNQLRFMSSWFEVIAVSSPDDVLDQVGAQEGVRTAAISMHRAITPVKDLVALWKLVRLFRKERPAIVHTHTPKAGLLGMLAARITGVPVRLHTVAGMPLMETRGWKRKLLGFTERLTNRCATMVYPNSARLAQFMVEQKFCPAHKINVLGNGSSNGIDTAYFSCTAEVADAAHKLKAKLRIGPTDFVYVFVGRLVKEKGIEELVTAFRQLRQKHAHVKLLLVGSFEPERDPVSEEITDIILSDPGIIFTGFQHDIRPYLAISQVLAFPSWREGFPNAPMQAGCMHVPAIVTDINGCNEIVQHGKNGLLIPVRNISALQQAMEQLLTNGTLYLYLRGNARRMICNRYDQEYFWHLLLEEYGAQLRKNI